MGPSAIEGLPAPPCPPGIHSRLRRVPSYLPTKKKKVPSVLEKKVPSNFKKKLVSELEKKVVSKFMKKLPSEIEKKVLAI